MLRPELKNQPSSKSSGYLSDDKEFNELKLTLVDAKETSGRSANQTKDLIGEEVVADKKEESTIDDEEKSQQPAQPKKRRFTVKRGATVGNTLAELAAQLILKRVGEDAYAEVERENRRYAKAFLVTEGNGDHEYKTVQEFIGKGLYVASRWQPDLDDALNACRLFGYPKRMKAAGTRHAELFEGLRALNAACDLGLEHVFHGTSFIADLDFHTDNFLLNFDFSGVVEKSEKAKVKALHKQFKELFYANKKCKNAFPEHLKAMITIINQIKQVSGTRVYFHKIDHDSGLYRVTEDSREVSLTDHGTSMSAVKLKEGSVRTQPTNHLAELLVGTNPENLLFSRTSLTVLQANSIEKRLEDTQTGLTEFFLAIGLRCEKSLADRLEALRAELALLKYFYQHITSGKKSVIPVPQLKTEEELSHEIGIMQETIQEKMRVATMKRYIALNNEYLDYLDRNAQDENSQAIRKTLQSYRRRPVTLRVEENVEKIIQTLRFVRDRQFKEEERALYDSIAKKPVAIDGIKLENYLRTESNRNRPLYKAIEKHIGEEFMPLYKKSSFKKFREGLSGYRKIAFWAGVGLMGAVALGVVGAAIAFSFGAAIPVVLPAYGALFGGLGVGSATIAAATNPATGHWLKQTTPLKRAAFVVGSLAVLVAATVLTGGAVLALAAAVSVAVAVSIVIGAKVASGAGLFVPVLAAKSAVAATSAVEGLSVMSHVISSTTTKRIAQGLQVSPEVLGDRSASPELSDVISERSVSSPSRSENRAERSVSSPTSSVVSDDDDSELGFPRSESFLSSPSKR